MEIDIEVDDIRGAGHLRWPRLNASHVDIVFLQHAERIIQDAWAILKRQKDASSVLHIPKLNSVVWVALSSEGIGQVSHTHHAAERLLLRGHK